MEESFWLERWERQQIGFHQRNINPRLLRFWPDLGLARDGAVFVPLCGKSTDMIWLQAQGHPVLGVELSPVAVATFFAENGLAPQRRRQGKFEVTESDGIRILRGDFFDLTAGDLAGVEAVYDRAALIAMPPAMRERYAAHMVEILPPATRMLLLTLDYPQEQMQGPPFSVPPDEVERLYGSRGDVRLLSRDDVLAKGRELAERGVTTLHECVFRVTLRG